MQAVDRLFEILEYLAVQPEGAKVLDIAESVSLSQSVVHRFLNALKKHDYVNQDAQTKYYKLSMKFFRLSINQVVNNDFRKTAYSHLRKLSKDTESFVFLSIIENNNVICIDTIQPEANISYFVKVGTIMPANSSAAAQAIFAYKDPMEIETALDMQSFRKYTDKTLVGKSELINKLARVKEDGYAICDEEVEEGVIGVAVPIRNIIDHVGGSITILKSKTSDFDMEFILDRLKTTATEISQEIGI